MKVQLSPWEVCSTALPSLRRRSRSSTKAEESRTQVVATFVPSRRSRVAKKPHASKEDVKPLIMVTREHKISVFGRSTDGGTLVESNVCQYASRPGSATSFLSTDPLEAASIPALIDPRSDFVYALQNRNTKIVSWPVRGSPDDAQPISLDSPACSLSLLELPNNHSIVYGGCADGRTFLLRCDESKNASVHYLASPDAKGGAILVGVHAILLQDDRRSRKRKAVGEKADEKVIFCNVFHNGGSQVILHRRVVPIESIGSGAVRVKSSQSSSLSLNDGDAKVQSISIAGFSSESMMVTLSYQIQQTTSEDSSTNGKTCERKYFTSLSLESGSQVGPSVEISNDIKGVGLVSHSLLATIAPKELQFYDVVYGSLQGRCPTDRFASSGDLTVVCDPERSSLALLYQRDGQLSVAVTNLSVVELHSTSLASKLEATHSLKLGWAHAEQKSSSDSSCTGLSLFLDACQKIRKLEKTARKKRYLLDIFEKAALIMNEGSSIYIDHHDNPQDAISAGKMKNGMNGVHKTESNGTYTNGLYPAKSGKSIPQNGEKKVPPPLSMPLEMVDEILTLVVEVLCRKELEKFGSTHEDAGQILLRILATGKLSSRKHFRHNQEGSISNILEALKTSSYSPFQFASDLLKHCSDVSEYQMVSVLRYALRHFEQQQAKVLLQQLFSLVMENLSYSDCNENLLGGAFKRLCSPSELEIVGHLLVRFVRSRHCKDGMMLQRAICWLDAVVGATSVSDVNNGDVEYIQRTIAAEVRRTRDIVSLYEDVQRCTAKFEAWQKEEAEKKAAKKKAIGQLPAYQIERLIL